MIRVLASLAKAGLWLASVGVAAAEEPLRRVLHVDPYHAGNAWNDRIAQAVRATL